MRLDDAKEFDLAKRAEELAREAEELRQDRDANAAERGDRGGDEDKLSTSIEKLRRIAGS